jgi:hypothetical protein
MSSVDAEITKLLEDPSTSFWLRDALRAALSRDYIDAANDAAILAVVLESRAQQLLSQTTGRS